ncbi:MAG: phage holin, LLH family [Bacillota bacterium]
MQEILESLGNLGLLVIGLAMLVVGEALVRRYLPLVQADRQLRLIETVVDSLAWAAKQQGWNHEDKRQFVLEQAARLLAERGIRVSQTELEVALERAFYYLHLFDQNQPEDRHADQPGD